MADHADKDIGRIDERLLRLASNPLRLKILVVLNERALSVSEIASHLNLKASVVGRELERMREARMVEIVGEVLSRGAVEPRYRPLMRALWSDEEWSALSLEERQRLSAWVIEVIGRDAREAIEAGTFNGRPDSHVSRTVSLVDEQGWRELCRIQEEALEAVLRVHEASGERLAERGEGGIPAMSAMICCELPPLGERAGLSSP